MGKRGYDLNPQICTKGSRIVQLPKLWKSLGQHFAILLEPESLFDMSESEMDFSNIGIELSVILWYIFGD